MKGKTKQLLEENEETLHDFKEKCFSIGHKKKKNVLTMRENTEKLDHITIKSFLSSTDLKNGRRYPKIYNPSTHILNT